MCNLPAVQSQPLIFITIAFFIFFPKNWTMEMFTGPPPVKIKPEEIRSHFSIIITYDDSNMLKNRCGPVHRVVL
jgi:hypothetical protein